MKKTLYAFIIIVAVFAAGSFAAEKDLAVPGNWKAKWIGEKPIRLDSTVIAWKYGPWFRHSPEPAGEKPACFRATFVLPAGKNPRTARARLVAETGSLFLNGKPAGQVAPGQVCGEMDIKKLLKPGKNIIALEVRGRKAEPAGINFCIRLDFPDQSIQWVFGGPGWKASQEPGNGWQKPAYNDSAWGKPSILAAGPAVFGSAPGDFFFERQPALLLRTEVAVPSPVRAVRAYCSSLGPYEVRMNGQLAFKYGLTPENAGSGLHYQGYSVNRIQPGKNAIGVILASGWRCGESGPPALSPYAKWPLRFIMQLVVEYADGGVDTMVTDESWKTYPATLRYNCQMQDEAGGSEITGWAQTGFDDRGWKRAGELRPIREPFLKP